MMPNRSASALLVVGLLAVHGLPAQVLEDASAVAVSTSAPTVHDFVVTGIFGREADGYIALVEFLDGRHLRVRVGDRIGTAAVEEVTAHHIRIRMPGALSLQTIPLKGTGRQIEATALAAPTTSGRSSSRRPSDEATSQPTQEGADSEAASPMAGAPDAMQDDVDGPGTPLPHDWAMGQLAQELDRLLSELPGEGPPDELGTLIGPLLGLPADAQVVELQSAPLRHMTEGLRYMQSTAQDNEIIRLTIETGGERQRVMVMPGSEGAPARVHTFTMGAAYSPLVSSP
ncbi:hypothetical protein [Thiohalocapsa sp. ML1]|jgi:hypothetical protein|uniref:hypothetical protein n=1 Tax=Thiohalocapsa sp. ML1 TaxID=1431688 RepID=UPI00073241F8|nr:hypothetical protein [Thiohalocapsa sp. ML1]